MSLNGKKLNILIDFDFVVNTELGLIRLIRNFFRDDRAFKLDILDKSDREILSLLYSRKNVNPLSIISTEDNISNIDNLYKSFLDSYKKEIIFFSTTEKSIYTFITSLIQNGTNNVYFCTKDEYEKKSLKSHFKKIYGFTNIRNREEILNMDPYYVKDYTFFTDNNFNVKGKNIYITNRQYSIDYFSNNDNSLTRVNNIVLIGKDFRKINE